MNWVATVQSSLISNWQTFDWLIAVFIFLAYFVVDALYVKYALAVVAKKAVSAANFGSLMYVLMAFGIFNYTHNFYILFQWVSALGWELMPSSKENQKVN